MSDDWRFERDMQRINAALERFEWSREEFRPPLEALKAAVESFGQAIKRLRYAEPPK